MFYDGYIDKNNFYYKRKKFLKKVKYYLTNNFDIESFSLAAFLFIVLIFFIIFNFSFFYESINLIIYKNKDITKIYFDKYKSTNFLTNIEANINENESDLINDEKIDPFILLNKIIYSKNIYSREIFEIINSIGGESNIILEPVNFVVYKTGKGDTLWDIAKRFGISVDSIYSANRDKLKDAHSLKVSEEIVIPTQTGILIKVENIDDLNKKIDEYDVDILSIYIANRVATKEELVALGKVFFPNVELPITEKLKAYGVDFGLPVYGYITSGFGFRIDPFIGIRRFHSGMDIANLYGTPIYSAYAGTVIYTGWDGGYGLKIVIKHPLGYETIYGHLSKISVKVGQTVSKGQLIGYMGSSGRSTGSHLHFEIRRFNKLLNPRFYIRGLPFKRK
ncbi:MAG: peptidoglycan DD-metalloendopeptidase family protein [Spirochaetes bacterium]|nr:peptidoglycan DD-metalloendopeptidase family protein [Spirochaetota bacterium]